MVSGTTQVLGVFGDPIAHSLSPQLHNWFAESTGLDSVYVPFHVRPEALERAVGGLTALSIRGVNLTVPHKEAVVPLVDNLAPAARAIGAVNTIINEHGQIFGDNTDARGLLADLRARFSSLDWESRPALVLGAGGAARAAVVALKEAGLPAIWVANRTEAKARDLVSALCPETGISLGLSTEGLAVATKEAGLIINTTSLGLKGETIPGMELSLAKEETAVYDLIYNPPVTPLLHEARQRGLAASNGLGMLVRQGAISFELWTGHVPPVEPVIEALVPAFEN
jgi:shikimate dehydrogenase